MRVGSINGGGGGTLRCSVSVTNNFLGITPTPTVTCATVNQCVGSNTTGTVMTCLPFPATTSGATITQCNGTANGGGASLTCTASGTQSSGLAVLINQCNDSSNGGGTLTVCSASITNNVTVATASPGPTASPAATASSAPSTPPARTTTTQVPNTSVTAERGTSDGSSTPVLLAVLALLASLAMLARRGLHSSVRPITTPRGR